MNIDDISTYFIVNLVFWVPAFIFLFRISSCRVSTHRNIHNPNFSVIIPARNEENTLPTLLNSLSGQLSSQDEIIVVDDHSEDRRVQ